MLPTGRGFISMSSGRPSRSMMKSKLTKPEHPRAATRRRAESAMPGQSIGSSTVLARFSGWDWTAIRSMPSMTTPSRATTVRMASGPATCRCTRMGASPWSKPAMRASRRLAPRLNVARRSADRSAAGVSTIATPPLPEEWSRFTTRGKGFVPSESICATSQKAGTGTPACSAARINGTRWQDAA